MKVGAAFAAVGLWATNAVAAGFALDGLGVVQVLALQFGGAVVTLAVLRVLLSEASGGMSGATVRDSVVGVLGGVFVGVIGLTGTIILQYVAFATAPIVEASVISYGWPLFAALWAAVAYRSRQTIAGIPFAMAGFAGVALILGSGDLGFDGGGAGYVAALASAGCMTFFTVMSGRSSVSAGGSLLISATFGMGCMLALCAAGIAPWLWDPSGAWAASIYAGVGPMAGGFLLWSRAMSGGGAKRLAPLGYATPLLSTALLMLTGEPFTPGALPGAALVLVCSIGVLIVGVRGRG